MTAAPVVVASVFENKSDATDKQREAEKEREDRQEATSAILTSGALFPKKLTS